MKSGILFARLVIQVVNAVFRWVIDCWSDAAIPTSDHGIMRYATPIAATIPTRSTILRKVVTVFLCLITVRKYTLSVYHFSVTRVKVLECEFIPFRYWGFAVEMEVSQLSIEPLSQ